MDGLMIHNVNLKDKVERQKIEDFLQNHGLKLDEDVDYSIVLQEKNVIKATCSKSRNILKCFAISEELRGENITASLISKMMDKLFKEEIYHSFIFTKPDKINIFTSLNYKLIHKVQGAALLENGIYNIDSVLKDMAIKYKIDSTSEKSSLVMNCNPFTLGHQYIIEEAAKISKELLVFIVQEDKSIFPFDVRYKLACEGTSHLSNVKIIPGTEYIISSATFPSYFIKKEDERLKTYTELDAGIFCKYFCKKLNIKKRFVGEENHCKVTKIYNDTLNKILNENNVKLIRIKRKKIDNAEISAFMVRTMIKEGKMNAIENFLPKTTLRFINSGKGGTVVEKIKYS